MMFKIYVCTECCNSVIKLNTLCWELWIFYLWLMWEHVQQQLQSGCTDNSLTVLVLCVQRASAHSVFLARKTYSITEFQFSSSWFLCFSSWSVHLSFLSVQGSCLQSEEHLSLQINLLARGDRPADLDKLKPYVIEHILVLLVAPTAGPVSIGGFISALMFMASYIFMKQL